MYANVTIIVDEDTKVVFRETSQAYSLSFESGNGGQYLSVLIPAEHLPRIADLIQQAVAGMEATLPVVRKA